MSDPTPSQNLVEELATSLEKELDLQRMTLSELCAKNSFDKVIFVLNPMLRVAHHFDPRIDILIRDDFFGTLGVVQILGSSQSVAADLRRLVDEAAYLRHLLLTNSLLPGDASDHSDDEVGCPFTVELVIVSLGDEASLQHVGQALREISQESNFLEAIGVNVLHPPFSEKSLRRAFPWLLQKTRGWYQRLGSEGAEVQPCGQQGRQSRQLEVLELENFRLRGRRSIHFNTKSRLHLMHGLNGSGKSSIVEALELMVTGGIDRLTGLRDPAAYESVIRNRETSEPAYVRITYHNTPSSPSVAYRLGQSGPQPWLAPELKASSFRLDQTLMDRLSRFGDVQRAQTFLESFFPKEAPVYEDYQQCMGDAKKAFNDLPPNIQQFLLGRNPDPQAHPALLVELLDWLNAENALVPAEVLPVLLPLPLAPAPGAVAAEGLEANKPQAVQLTLPSLVPLAPELSQPLKEWTASTLTTTAVRGLLRRIDDTLANILKTLPPSRERIKIALATMKGIAEWHVAGDTGIGDDFPTLLNRWLETVALADLAEKHYHLSRSLNDAAQTGWSPMLDKPIGLFGEPKRTAQEIEELQKQGEALARDRDQMLGRLAAGYPPTISSGGNQRRPRPYLTDTQLAALDSVGQWLFPPQPGREAEALGRCIADAIAKNVTVSVGSHAIGTVGWAEPLARRLRDLEALSGALAGLNDSNAFVSGSRRLELLEKAEVAHAKLESSGKVVSSTFLAQISGDNRGDKQVDSGLNDAINELMALFTPARWAYQDLVISHRMEGDNRHLLNVTTDGDGARMDFRFNTAELNLFTIALFLLCAVRCDNPLRLLVLDDPLQNMDELTVTTLARGLSKIVRLLPQEWQLLLLFHGGDDVESFRRELPAAFYTLPWLSPAGQAKPLVINADATGPASFEQFRSVPELLRRR
jgi:hypothetical protein